MNDLAPSEEIRMFPLLLTTHILMFLRNKAFKNNYILKAGLKNAPAVFLQRCYKTHP